MSNKSKSKIQKLFTENHYKKFLMQCRDEITQKFPGFWSSLSQQEQLTWLDSVVRDSKKLGFGNEYLIKDYMSIVCKIGKDFLQDPDIDNKIVRFITDTNFSPYVRTRDTNRWIDKNLSKITKPERI
ncbi:hypothetical protein GCM10023151_13340 [Kangiella marina]|uniref:Uncharacterized protein n=1 Tax=Kangiella marina TaxID=1079178 RepID=A0ABP8IJR6_9GAMM